MKGAGKHPERSELLSLLDATLSVYFFQLEGHTTISNYSVSLCPPIPSSDLPTALCLLPVLCFAPSSPSFQPTPDFPTSKSKTSQLIFQRLHPCPAKDDYEAAPT